MSWWKPSESVQKKVIEVQAARLARIRDKRRSALEELVRRLHQLDKPLTTIPNRKNGYGHD